MIIQYKIVFLLPKQNILDDNAVQDSIFGCIYSENLLNFEEKKLYMNSVFVKMWFVTKTQFLY